MKKKVVKSTKPSTVIQNNVFETKIWDAKAIDAVTNISKAILNMTELFKAQNINITCIEIGTSDNSSAGKV